MHICQAYQNCAKSLAASWVLGQTIMVDPSAGSLNRTGDWYDWYEKQAECNMPRGECEFVERIFEF